MNLFKLSVSDSLIITYKCIKYYLIVIAKMSLNNVIIEIFKFAFLARLAALEILHFISYFISHSGSRE